jgi:hypothetical protein
VNPLTVDYSGYTPYQFAGNMPISAIDFDGTEPQKAGTSDGQEEKAPDGGMKWIYCVMYMLIKLARICLCRFVFGIH